MRDNSSCLQHILLCVECLFEPEKWNKNCLVVDAWSGSVYTQAGFVLINTKVPHYGISNNIKGDTQHIIKYAGGKTSYRAYKNNKMIVLPPAYFIMC
jgi:hypothetical protein